MEAMDFMDPRRRMRHTIMLIVGYVLIAVALLLLTVILIFVAYGFGLKNGRVIQSGLLFLSSTPNPAHIYMDGKRYTNDTNTKLVLQEGTYHFTLARDGYRDWQRTITVTGGQVESYAYPFLFPTSLTTNTTHSYSALPSIVTESSDRHWLLVQQPDSLTTFDLYDLTNRQPTPTPLTLPADLLTATTEQQSLQVVSWADDNNHLLLKHLYGANAEYILASRSAPGQSVNLTKTFNLPLAGTDLRLDNDHSDQYLVLDTQTHQLFRATLGTAGLRPYIKDVLSFAIYDDNTVLYATPDPTDATKVSIDLFDGNNTYIIRHDAIGATYLLAAANFDGDMMLATAASNESLAYVYRNPIDQLTNARVGVAVPEQVFSIQNPVYVSVSPNGQYAMFENKTKLAVYDADNSLGFNYAVPDVLDAPQAHVGWMDSARLAYVSKGQIVVFDYDGQNRQALVSADPRESLIFDPSYKFLYAFVPSASDKNQELLTSTSLRTPADQ